MFHARMINTIVLPNGALVIENKVDSPMVNTLKGVGINMATLPWETLYVLQDRVTTKLSAREGHALEVLSEQRINMEQLSLQHDKVITQNR